MAKQKKAPKPTDGRTLIATNRAARRDFDLFESMEAGIMLRGSEVKSLREGHVQFADANVWIDNGEAWAMGLHIQPWGTATGRFTHEPERRRKLLLHKHEIERLMGKQATERLAIVPIQLYFKEGRVKVEIALARGRKQTDKRNLLAERDAARDIERTMARRQSGKASLD